MRNATLKREIPAGWNDSILGKFIELDRGVTYSKGMFELG